MTRRTEPGEFFSTALKLIEKGQLFAVATVLRAEGSTPVPAGAKAVIEADGTIHGTVGGGVAEAEAQRRAKEAVRSNRPVVFEFGLHGPGPHEPAPICGGSMRLLVDPKAANNKADFQRAAEALGHHERGIWLTTLQSQPALRVSTRFVTRAEAASHRGFPGETTLISAMTEERPMLVVSPADNTLEVFVEPLIPKPMLVIVGGGHVGRAVAAQASLVDFEIVVIEDRPEFADARWFPSGSMTRCGNVAEEVSALPIGPDTFIVIVTRGHQQDAEALRACIRRPATYIGMIGSRRKVPLLRRHFLESGWCTVEEFDRVHAPIGLDIGAVTVPEIAASIIAQMIAVRRKGIAPKIPLA